MGAWSSALSTTEFAACLAAGLQPVGFVQGCSVVSWNFAGYGFGSTGFGFSAPTGGYYEQFSCPHGFVSAEHRLYGMNYEKSWVESTWTEAFTGAYERLVGEAAALGAHGVIGIVERREAHNESAAYECSLSGTAVRIAGEPARERPFTTYLAGQKLNKLYEAGLAPVAIVACLVSIGVFESCITELQMRGSNFSWGVPNGEISQLSRAENAARSLARERVRSQLGNDVLHGAELFTGEYESSQGPQIEITLRGNRVRRFREASPLAPPRPVVNLIDR